MRNKYSKEFEAKMIKLAPKKTLDELLQIAKSKFNYNITKKQLQSYLSKRQIRYKNYNKNKVRTMGMNYPIGSEYVKDDGMTLIKVAHNKWKYKQRYLYEQYHKVKLTSDNYIIFLDQDRTNFDINNLVRISRHESSILSNQKMFSKDPNITKLGITVADLMIMVKDKSNNL